MRVLLINPPRENEIIGNNPSIIEEERGFNPPLGLLYLAGHLREHTAHAVTVLDAQVERMTYADVEARVRTVQPDVVGITAMTLTLLDVIRTVETVKQAHGNTRVVVGGPHANLYPQQTLALPGIDYVMLGEGEVGFAELLDAIDDRQRLRRIGGVVFRDGEEVVNTGPRQLIDDLDALPFPARDLVPYRQYSSLLSSGGVVTTIMTSRGCPFRCTFCDRPHLGKRFRARSAENVVAELEQCLEMGISDFLFYDDTFTIQRQRVHEICAEIGRRGLKLNWDIRARVDTVDEDVLRALKRAGCQGVHYGIEAGTEKVLQALGKQVTLDQVRETVGLTRKVGLPTLAYFMIGNPSETRADIQATMRFMKSIKADYVHITILTPFPGTRVYADGLQRGVIPRDVWLDFARDPTPDFVPPRWNEHLSNDELDALLKEAYHAFYLRPSYVARRVLKVRSLRELATKAKAALSLVRMS